MEWSSFVAERSDPQNDFLVLSGGVRRGLVVYGCQIKVPRSSPWWIDPGRKRPGPEAEFNFFDFGRE
jgi:hypothetical protein